MNSVRTRLAAISAVVMMAVAAVVVLLVYTQLHRTLDQRTETALISEWHEFQSIYRDGGLLALEKELGFEQHTLGTNGGFMRVYNDEGIDVPSEDLSPWGSAAEPLLRVSDLHLNSPYLDYAQGDRNQVRVRRLHGLLAPGIAVVMAYGLEENYAVLMDIGYRLMILLGCLSIPILFGAWLMARHTMRGVEAVTQTATRIASGHLDQRVPLVDGGRELAELASAFNSMVDHLAKVFREIRETNDNIAHDLRTPITGIRTAAESLLLDQLASEHVHRVAADAVQECDNLLSAVNTMLDISEVEAGVRKLNLEQLDLRQLIEECCELFGPALAERDMKLTCRLNGAAPVQADKQLLRRAICNVLDNAVKYSNNGGALDVALDSTQNETELTISDTGFGIAQTDLPHVFDRFFRGDKARSHRGNGLGLGLVKAIMVAHGGEVSLSSILGEGTSVVLQMSAADQNGMRIHP